MSNKIRFRADARAAVAAAGLLGEWFPCGCAVGFADWLYISHKEVTPTLERERVAYVSTVLASYESGIGANELFAKEANARAAFEAFCLTASARISGLQASLTGRRAFSALRELATTAGRSIGAREQCQESLRALRDIRSELWMIAAGMKSEALSNSFQQFGESHASDWSDFGQIARSLRDAPEFQLPLPRPAALLIAACGTLSIENLIRMEMNRASMSAVINGKTRQLPQGRLPERRRALI